MALNIRPTEDCLKLNLPFLMPLHAAAVFLCKSDFERRDPLCFQFHIERKLYRANTQRNVIRPTAASVEAQSLVK